MINRAVDPARFRDVFSHLPTGVTVVAAYGSAGMPTGMACNSVTSLSLEPPLVLVCPARSSTTWPAIRDSGAFCISVLAHHDARTSRRFAARGVDRFAEVDWHRRGCGPALDDAAAWIDCVITAEYDGGDHHIVVGRVEALTAAAAASPLIFYRGHYEGLASGRGCPSPAA